MVSERQLRTEFRRALDDVLPAAPWLETAVTEDLRKRRQSRSANRGLGTQLIPAAPPRGAMRLVAGGLAAALAVAAVVAVIELRSRAQHSVPTSADLTTAYQAMVDRDSNHVASINTGTYCQTLQSVCPAPGTPVIKALQRFLNDLNGSKPPARFASINAQLRRHLAAHISEINALIAAHQAQDQVRFDRANSALNDESQWISDVVGSILSSHLATVATYTEAVQAGKANVAANPSLQLLGTSRHVDCMGIQSPKCENDVMQAKSTIEVFEAALVHNAAPGSLAAQDSALQRDLAQADTGLLAMGNAELAGDQAAFDAGRLLLQQALPAVNADIAGIVGG